MTLVSSKGSGDPISSADVNRISGRLQDRADTSDATFGFHQVFNVKRYGALGDGATDDSAAIQLAFNDVPVAGGSVFFPRSTYLIGTTLKFNPNNPLVIYGDGIGATQLTMVSGASTHMLRSSDETTYIDNLTIRDMTLTGNKGTQTAGKGIILKNIGPSTNAFNAAVFLQNLIVRHFKDSNIFIDSLASYTFGRVFMSNVFSRYSDFNGLTLSSSASNRIYAFKAVECTFDSCAADNFWSLGCRLNMTACDFLGSTGGNGAQLRFPARGSIVGCTGAENALSGLAIVGGSQLQIIGGIYRTNGLGAGGNGITFSGAATYHLVQGIRAYSDDTPKRQSYGISEVAPANFNLFIGNIVYGNLFGGINLTGATSIARSNPGFNPVGLATFTINTSPYTYTNQDMVPEMIFISGGTLSSFVKNGATLFTSTPANAWLEPWESVKLVYSSTPVGIKDRK